MTKVEAARLEGLVNRFRRCRLLVIGDLMLDRFIWGAVERISPEAPVPVVRITSESFQLGGAANVVHNVKSLGGKVTACGFVGRDAQGKRLLAALNRIGVSTAGVFALPHFQTTQKTRIIATPRHQQIVRLDRENHSEIGRGALRRALRFVETNVGRFDCVVVSDYGKGAIGAELLDFLAGHARQKQALWIVDPKQENFHLYRRASLVTPNKEEASQAAGIRIRDEASLRAAGRRLLELWDAAAVLITRGQEGMSLFRADGAVRDFPTAAREVFDVTGAGDTVVATCALALASRASYEEAAVLANLAAGIVVGEVGTFAVPHERLQAAIRNGIRPGGGP
ncbi:MAG TPA: D-glycero-beta-D-manno-heptose-7-phosphate kinase [Candidatus Acidoferrales bacterium]|nr:D-glycero-beta-D-manno-heptose-7-phosphate kinase [Candidatus Acidoferrales bacterium]